MVRGASAVLPTGGRGRRDRGQTAPLDMSKRRVLNDGVPPVDWPRQTITEVDEEPPHAEGGVAPQVMPALADAEALAQARARAAAAAQALAQPPPSRRLPSPNSIEWKAATVVGVSVATAGGARAVSPADVRRGRSPGALFGANARALTSPHRAMLLRTRTPPRGERHGAPGSRRHRRFTNEQFLLKSKVDFTEEELRQLLDPVEWKGENPWQDDKLLWEKFCNATPEEQSRMLGSNKNTARRADPTRLNRRTRTLLRGHAETQFGRDVFSRIGAFAANDEVKLVITMPSDAQSSMHRRVCHDVARYYGFKSTTQLGNDDTTRTTVVIRKTVVLRSPGAPAKPAITALLDGTTVS